MSTIALRRLDPATTPEHYYLEPGKLLAGNPRQSVWRTYDDPAGRFFVGHWASEVGKWRIHYTEFEYCELLEGVSILTDAAGQSSRVCAGDRFVIPRGFEGTWEVIEPTRKVYVIYEPAAT